MSIKHAGLGLLVALIVSSCAPVMQTHGFVPTKDDLDQLVVGADSMASVEEIAGAPTGTGLRDDSTWYYVSSRVRNFMFFAPKTVDRTVLVLDFDDDGTLTAMTEYGLEDGQVIDLDTRITPTDRRRASILTNLLRGIGPPRVPVPS